MNQIPNILVEGTFSTALGNLMSTFLSLESYHKSSRLLVRNKVLYAPGYQRFFIPFHLKAYDWQGFPSSKPGRTNGPYFSLYYSSPGQANSQTSCYPLSLSLFWAQLSSMEQFDWLI